MIKKIGLGIKFQNFGFHLSFNQIIQKKKHYQRIKFLLISFLDFFFSLFVHFFKIANIYIYIYIYIYISNLLMCLLVWF